MARTLSTSQYTLVGNYLAQIIQPKPGTVTAGARMVCYIGKGSRLASVKNATIKRSFVYEEELTFSSIPPFIATIVNNANGVKDAPAKLYDSSGVEVRQDFWDFIKVGDNFKQIQIAREYFDMTKTYYLDYQSIDRGILDPMPIDDIRKIMAVGKTITNADFREYQDFYLKMLVTDPLADISNMYTTRSLALSRLSGTGINLSISTTAAYSGDYNRVYKIKCLRASAVRKEALFVWWSYNVFGGNEEALPTPLDSYNVSDIWTNEANPPNISDEINYFTLREGVTEIVALELGITITSAFTDASLFIAGDTWQLKANGAGLVELDTVHTLSSQYQGYSAINAGNSTGTIAVDLVESDYSSNLNRGVAVKCINTVTNYAIGKVIAIADVAAAFSHKLLTITDMEENTEIFEFALSSESVTSGHTKITYVTADTAATIAGLINSAINNSTTLEVSSAISGTVDVMITQNLPGDAGNGTGITTTVVGMSVYDFGYDPSHEGYRTADFIYSSYKEVVNDSSKSITPFQVDDRDPATMTAQQICHGIAINFDFGTMNYAGAKSEATIACSGVGSTQWTKNIVINDGFSTYTFQYYDTVVPAAPIYGIAVLAADDASAIAAKTKTAIEDVAKTGKIRVFDVAIDGAVLTLTHRLHGTYNNTITTTTAFAVTGFSGGVALDTFTFNATLPKQFYFFKDDRDYSLSISSVVDDAGNKNISGGFTCNTPEGRFGSFSTVSSASDSSKTGRVILPDNVHVIIRNAVSEVRVAANDKFTFSGVSQDVLDWSLYGKATQTVYEADVVTDVIGSITGIPNTKYVILSYVPDSVTSVKDVLGNSVSYSTVTGTQFIYFITAPTSGQYPLSVSYDYKGSEPAPGDYYYLSGEYLRPTEVYNTPQRILGLEDGKLLLAPSAIDNHLYIMNDIVWKTAPKPFGAYFVQVKDVDGDGIYTKNDFMDAMRATLTKKDITDRVVLSHFDSLADQLAINIIANDPFKKSQSLDWFGTPIGTEIGDVETLNSLVFLSRKTLQVYGDSQSHGTRILVAPTWCKYTIRLENGTEQQITLDGSFVAGAMAAKKSGHANPSQTFLMDTLTVFDEIQTYSESEDLILGDSNLIFFLDEGSSVYRIYEDITVDKYAPDFEMISAMTQKQTVTRVVNDIMQRSLTGLTVKNGSLGVARVTGVLAMTLLSIHSSGIIGDWQDDAGNERAFDSSSDIYAFRDQNNPTLYRYAYRYFLIYPIKRCYGVFLVDSNESLA